MADDRRERGREAASKRKEEAALPRGNARSPGKGPCHAGADDEALVHPSRIAVPYKWSAGLTLSRFLKTVAEERRFLASRCPSCRKVSVPPLKACGRCFADNEQGVAVGPLGTLLSFTEASPAGRPGERGTFALIRLDGADTAILHRLEGTSCEELAIGQRVEPVFDESPQASPLGVRCFRRAQ